MKVKLILVLLVLVTLAAVVVMNGERIGKVFDGVALDVFEAVEPHDFGPVQELNSRWAAAPPTLDGVLSPGEWAAAAAVDIDGTDKKRPGVASGDSSTHDRRTTRGLLSYDSSHATFYLMNDENRIYVAVDVTDDVLDFETKSDQIWAKDSVEIRVDGNFSRHFFKEEDRFGHSPIMLGNGEKTRVVEEYVRTAAAEKPDGSGYVVELSWDSTDFKETIGFDVAISESDDPDIWNRNGQYYWNGTRDGAWRDEREWGIVHLATEAVGAGQ